LEVTSRIIFWTFAAISGSSGPPVERAPLRIQVLAERPPSKEPQNLRVLAFTVREVPKPSMGPDMLRIRLSTKMNNIFAWMVQSQHEQEVVFDMSRQQEVLFHMLISVLTDATA